MASNGMCIARAWSLDTSNACFLGQYVPGPGNMPTWNPSALLQPHRRTPETSRSMTPGHASPIAHRQGPNSAPPSRKNTPIIFEFPTAEESQSAAPSPSGPSTPRSMADHHIPAASHWIERTHNLQDRSDVPQPKRRRTEDGQDAKIGIQMPVRSGSGVLGEYVKSRHKEPNGHSSSASLSSSATVDLTGSKCGNLRIALAHLAYL